jgi:hypothetical protein
VIQRAPKTPIPDPESSATLTVKEAAMRIRKNRLTISIALLTSLLLSPIGLAGQQANTANAPTGDWTRLSAVTPGSKLAVKLKNGKTVEGKLNSVSDTGLSLSITNKDQPCCDRGLGGAWRRSGTGWISDWQRREQASADLSSRPLVAEP